MISTAIFRADARPEIGSGHVIRSLALAAEWVDRGGRAVMHGDVPDGLNGRVADAGAELVAARSDRTLGHDLEQTTELARRSRADWVIIDGYVFDTDYVSDLRSAGLRTLQFADGVVTKPFAPDILLDQNLGAESRNYELITEGAQALLGVRYACLGQQFTDVIARKRMPEIATKVLVTFGGADADNATSVVVDALKGVSELESVTVVLGVSNVHADAIKRSCAADSRFECVRNVSNMAELMVNSDLAIAAAGSTSWELAALGVPSVLVTTADNQEPIARAVSDQGAAVSIGWIAPDDVEKVRSKVEVFATDRSRRESISVSGQMLVDGKGASRVVNAMLAHRTSWQDGRCE